MSFGGKKNSSYTEKLLQILFRTRWDMQDEVIKHSHCHAALRCTAALEQMVASTKAETRAPSRLFVLRVNNPNRNLPTGSSCHGTSGSTTELQMKCVSRVLKYLRKIKENKNGNTHSKPGILLLILNLLSLDRACRSTHGTSEIPVLAEIYQVGVQNHIQVIADPGNLSPRVSDDMSGSHRLSESYSTCLKTLFFLKVWVLQQLAVYVLT